MTTADIRQLHAFWMTMWNHLEKYKCLNLDEVHDTIISASQPKKHRFWDEFRKALGKLVVVPTDKESVRFHSRGDLPAVLTKNWLKTTDIDIPPNLRQKFAIEQPATFGGTNHFRLRYDAYDLFLLGEIARFFPDLASPPLDPDSTLTDILRSSNSVFDTPQYTLPRIQQFIADSAEPNLPMKAIIDVSADNIFIIHGRQGPLRVSLRKKLNTWRMRQAETGDNLHGPDVYVFL